MKIHRLVNELNLDWIFNCINMGKIDNMVRGSMTHTQTTFKINKQKKMLHAGSKAEARARVRCAKLAISMLSYS